MKMIPLSDVVIKWRMLLEKHMAVVICPGYARQSGLLE